MARVPVPSSQGAQSLGGQGVPDPVSTPQLRARAPDLTATSRAVAKNLQSTLASGAEIADTLGKQEDNRKLMELQNATKAWERENLFGPNGVYSRRNGNAIGATDEMEQRTEEATRQILDRMEMSGRARRTAEQWLSSRRQTVLDSVARHELTEREKYNGELMASSLQNSVEEAALFFNQPERFAAARERVRIEATEVGRTKGYDGDALDEFVDNHVSDMNALGIRRAISAGRTDVAQGILETAVEGGDLEGDQIPQLEEMVRSASNQQRAFQLTEAALAANPEDLEAQLEYVRTRAADNADLRNAAVSEVKVRNNEERAIQQDQQRRRYNNLRERIANGYDPTPADLQGLTEPQQKTLRQKRLDYRNRLANPDLERPTDYDVYNDLERRLAVNPQQLEDMSFEEFETRYYSGLSPKDWRYALGQWRAMQANEAERERAAAEGAHDVSGITESRSLNDTAELIAGPDAEPEALAQTKSRLSLEYDQRVRSLARQLGREPTTNERRDVLNNLAEERIVVDYGLFGGETEQATFMMTEDDRVDFVDDIGIPARYQEGMAQNFDRAVNAVRNSGMDVSRSTLQHLMEMSISSEVGEQNRYLFMDFMPLIVDTLTRNGRAVNRTNIMAEWQYLKRTDPRVAQ